jgi:hypothetical protein
MSKYSRYLTNLHYNTSLDYTWYDELKDKLNILESRNIKINIFELNRYLYDRYLFENHQIKEFDNTIYNLDKHMQIIEYKKINILQNQNFNYDADDEEEKKKDVDFTRMMDYLATKLEHTKFEFKF